MRYSLKQWNTFGFTWYANNLVCVYTIQQLLNAWKNAVQLNQPVLVLGTGSNVLFLENFLGTVIINRIMNITVRESDNMWYLHTGAGENWHRLVQLTLKKNMPGLENLALIPGCVGSSPIQNIGAYGVEFKQVCEYVDCIRLTTGELQRLTEKECRFGYRDSIFKHEYKGRMAVIAVGLKLHKMWHPVLTYGALRYLDPTKVTPEQIFNIICRIRMKKFPNLKVYGNAGSFFKNPIVSKQVFQTLLTRWPDAPCYLQTDGSVKLVASWLIDKCSLKGVSHGGAAVYHKQPVVLINQNGASSEDVVRLARFIRQRVGEIFNIWLEPEVCFIGCTGEVNAMEIIS